MKAIGFYKHGGPEVLQNIEVDKPKPGPGEVEIKMEATSVNRFDILVRVGYHGLNLSMPHIPGADVVGKVSAIGENVTEVSVGEAVVANTLYGCGKCAQCQSGNEICCNNWKIMGLQQWGSYGEFVNVPAQAVVKAPNQIASEELATMPISMGVAWRAMHTVADAQQGETAVIRGASGNVGIFALMIAKKLGLKVIALTRGEKRQKELKALGADLVLDTLSGNDKLIMAVQSFTDGNGADIVLDSFGSTINESVEMLRQGGIVVSYGVLTGLKSELNAKSFYLKSASIKGFHNTNKKDFIEALDFALKNNIHPKISKVMSIRDAREAQELLDSNALFGKIVLKHNF